MLLPEAFRSLSRLSSALSAKASTLRSYQLDLLLHPPSVGDTVHTYIALICVLIVNFFYFKSVVFLTVIINVFNNYLGCLD